jgi:hypothetical protein
MSLRELTNFLILISIFNEIKSYLKFNIPSDYDKCFEKEVYSEGSILIKYDLTGYDKEFKNENEQKNLFKNIKIFIKNKKNKNIYETELKSRKEKLAVKLQGPDRFKICARYNKPYRGRELNKDILLALKLTSNYDYKELNVNLKKSDVSNFWEKIYSIKRDMRDSIEAAKSEINDEDSSAKSMISSINLYYKLCCIQLSVIILLTIFNLWSYKDYFKKISLI